MQLDIHLVRINAGHFYGELNPCFGLENIRERPVCVPMLRLGCSLGYCPRLGLHVLYVKHFVSLRLCSLYLDALRLVFLSPVHCDLEHALEKAFLSPFL